MHRSIQCLGSSPRNIGTTRSRQYPRLRCNSLSSLISTTKLPLRSGGRPGTIRRPKHLQARSQQIRERQESGPYYSQEAPSFRDNYSPPPPPPPPPPPKRSSGRRPNFWGVLVLVMLGAALWWSYIDSQMPHVYRDKDNGLQYVMTDGGHKVVVGEDKAGRVYFVDSNGNFYYDTGSTALGFYMVTAKDEIFNIFGDKNGERQTMYVGSMKDLKTLKIEQLGGIPVSKLKKAFGKNFDGTITGFTSAGKGDNKIKKSDFGGHKIPKAIIGYEPDVVVETKGE